MIKSIVKFKEYLIAEYIMMKLKLPKFILELEIYQGGVYYDEIEIAEIYLNNGGVTIEVPKYNAGSEAVYTFQQM